MKDKPKLLTRLQLTELELTKFIEDVNAYTAGMTDDEFYTTVGLQELDKAMTQAVAIRQELRRIHYMMD